jgi:hypothetical protein
MAAFLGHILLFGLLVPSAVAINNTLDLRASTTGTELINPENGMPNCARFLCADAFTGVFSFLDEAISLLFGSVPELFIYQPGCSMVESQGWSKDCFCKLQVPLQCAWQCSWNEWMLAEDWYVGVCGPDADRLSYDGLPDCARNCLPEALFDHGCITEGRNCFCSGGELFGCAELCTAESDRLAVQNWIVKQCGASEELAKQAANDGQFVKPLNEVELLVETVIGVFKGRVPGRSEFGKEAVPLPSKGPKRLNWSETLAIFVASLSALAFLVGWFWVGKFKRQGERKIWGFHTAEEGSPLTPRPYRDFP